ncbi:MAG: hypothetical protein WC348_00740 [Patescibacteria group bacterium]|jgi:hypothetical protein
MDEGTIKNAILNKKILISVIVILLIATGVLFFQKQNYKYTLLYQCQAIPDIELKNTLQESQGGVIGEIRGFVKFDNLEDQPKDLRQYYIIKPLNKFDKDLSQYFSLEEVIKMQYLPPKSMGISELVEVNETDRIITLEDENGNQFFIDRLTEEVSMRDTTGDSPTLITSDRDYEKFIREWLK